MNWPDDFSPAASFRRGTPMSMHQPQQRSSGLSVLTLLLLFAVIGLLAYRLWPEIGRRGDGTDKSAQPRAIEPRGDLASYEKTSVDIFDQCAASSVHVQTFAAVRRDFSVNAL